MYFRIYTELTYPECEKIITAHNNKIKKESKSLYMAFEEPQKMSWGKRRAASMLRRAFDIAHKPIEWTLPELRRFSENDTAKLIKYGADGKIIVWIDDEWVKFNEIGFSLSNEHKGISKALKKEFKAIGEIEEDVEFESV